MAETEIGEDSSPRLVQDRSGELSFSKIQDVLKDVWGAITGRRDEAPKKEEQPNARAPKKDADDEDDESDEQHDHEKEGQNPSGKFVSRAPRPQVEANPNFPELKVYFGALHGHSVYSDGMCKPADLYASAKNQNMDFSAVTDHSHLAARQGVKPDNPRAPEQAKVPAVAQAPQLYNSTFHDAAHATDDKFVGLNGVELGTIGKVGSSGLAGVNHINIFEVAAFIESVKGGRTPKRAIETGHIPEETEFEKPEVWKIKDGDYKALVDRLDKIKDTSGGRPVIQLNHPRWSEDESEKLDESVRGRDYGQKSFKDQDEWRERFGKYASQLEILSGEALKEVQTGEFSSHSIHAKDFAGYLEKGLHISPTFGRDSHYCDAGGTPASTGILATALDKKSLLDGLRERRTFATTGRDDLAGYMEVNGKHIMGSIVDQNDSPNVHVTMTVASEVQSDAKYTAILWVDPNIGDGELAEKVQTIHIAGNDLIRAQNKIRFDQLPHVVGQKSAYYVEVQKRDSAEKQNRMWTAPVWVEPLAGRK